MTTRLRFEPAQDAAPDLSVAAAGEDPIDGASGGGRLRFASPPEQRRIKLKGKDPKAWQKQRAARKLRRRLIVGVSAAFAAVIAAVAVWMILQRLLA